MFDLNNNRIRFERLCGL